VPHFDAGGETDAIFTTEAAPTNLPSKLAA